MWDLIDGILRIFSGPKSATTPAGAAGAGVGDVRSLSRSWQEMPYPKAHPPGSASGVVDAVDLALFAGDLAQLYEAHFSHGLTEPERKLLDGAVRTLERIVPMLKGDGRPYFAAALDVDRWITRGSPA